MAFLADIDWDRWLSQYIIPTSIALLILLVPHLVAAHFFAPKAKFLIILAACVLQIAFAVLTFMAIGVMAFFGPWYLAGGGLIVFVLSALMMTGLYRIDFLKGLGYNAIVIVLAVGVSWGLLAYFTDAPLKRFATPIMLRLESRKFQTEDEARRAAIRHYPHLAVPGSGFNRKFLEKHRRYKADDPGIFASPGWPWVIAGEVAFENQVPRTPAP